MKKAKGMKVLVIVMVVLVLSLNMMACSKPPEETGKEGEETPPQEGFNWEMASGATLKVMFNQHPYAEAIIKKIPEFKEKTGINVEYSLTPEENYFDKLTIALNSRSGDPDLFMTGAYQIWEYAPAGYTADLDTFLNDPNMVDPDYNVDDFYEGIIGGLRWDLKAGHKVGKGPLWALPLGFESNVLAYNKRVFDEKKLEVPKTMEELLAVSKELQKFEGEGTYPLALRGTRNWATIHPGYMTTYSNYGAVDFTIEDGKLVSQVNSPEAVAMTEMWVDLIKAGGAPSWSSYTWYQAGADFGAGKAAMLFDATCNGYFQNPAGASEEAGNLAWVAPPLPEGKTEVNSNLWTWSMAINEASKNKTAAWLFLQYFTSADYQKWSITEGNAVDPPRKSVFESKEVQDILESNTGYIEAFDDTVPGTTIQFTPQPHFFQTTTEWAATLQDIVAGKYSSVQEAMDKLKVKMDEIVADVEAE